MKNIGTGITGIIIGSALMVTVSTLQADETITVENNPSKNKEELIVSIESPATVTYTIAEIKAQITRYDIEIRGHQEVIDKLNQQKSETQVLLEKLEAEVNKK